MTSTVEFREVALAYRQTLMQLGKAGNRDVRTVGALGIADDDAQLRRRIVMIAQGALPVRLQSTLAATLLMLFGTMAFCKPSLEKADEVAPAQAVAVASTAVLVPPVATMPASNPVSDVAVTTTAAVRAAAATRKIAKPAVSMVAAPETAATTADVAPVLTLVMADTNAMPSIIVSEAPPALAKSVVSAPAAPEEIVIVGRSLWEKMLNAEVKAYEIFNKFNDEKMFRISCLTYAPTGTRIMKQSCKPEFEIMAMKTHAQGYLENMQVDDVRAVSPSLREQPEVTFSRYLPSYQRKMKQVAETHPEFMQAIVRYNKLREEYLGLGESDKR